MKVGRNDPCPCGSGRKYKICCMRKQAGMPLKYRVLLISIVLIFALGAVLMVQFARDDQPRSGRVWSEEHQHWHNVP